LQVTAADPTRLDRLNPAVPRDLVTVVHKAIEPDPARRYAAAGELAADLRRFLDDQPVRARRVSGVERLARWAAGDAGEVVLWDVVRGEPVRRLSGHSDDVRRVVFYPDGTRLATAGLDGTIRIWDPATGAERLTLRGHQRGVMDVVVNRSGTRLASAGEDGTVRLWDAGSGRELAVLQGHRGPVRAVAFSRDGTRLASGGQDGTVRVWDAGSGAEVRAIKLHTDWVRAVAFSPDGEWLASGGSDGTIRLLDARPWTPAIHTALEARGLVAGLFAIPLSAAEVLDRVRQHRGLAPDVRRFALELAERHGPELPPVPVPMSD
jgi:hypothetical protein